jgi:hypothetical protein
MAQRRGDTARLRRQNKLQLKITKRIGKVYSAEEKAELIKATKQKRRSKGIHFVIMPGKVTRAIRMRGVSHKFLF